VGTTFRLWAKRRLDKPWWRTLLVFLLAAIVFLAGAITATLIRGNATSSSAVGHDVIPAGGGALAAVALARKQAATWVAQQVNPDEIIGCDPAMCAALTAAHIQANRLLVLDPSQPDPLGSEILLDTATLRSQFGARLETVYAPVSLAAFGSGAARIQVRFAAHDGARAYLAELARDVAARKAAGTEMVRNHSIHVAAAARRQLTAGQVDTRLLVTLVTLAHKHPVDIISFGANQAGASPGVPLRSAEIAGAPGPGSTPAVSVLTLRSYLSSQQPPYRPSIVAVTTASRRTVLRVGYPAPSLLGLLGTHG
jgi:Kef-type K+ transport system membrane component KefB